MTTRQSQRSAGRGAATGQVLARGTNAGRAAKVVDAPLYKGTVTTTGGSGALRFEKRFFVNQPAFSTGARVSAKAVAPGYVLLSVDAPEAVGDKDGGLDPLVGAFLSFMEADLVANPHKIQALDVKGLAELLEGVEPLSEGELPADFTL